MFYSYEITVDASTDEDDPKITIADVTAGIISQVSFRPRPGHAALCRCRVFYHDLQLFPFTRGESLHGDTFPITWPEFIELDREPYQLKIVAWNDDDTYAHTFDISFTILPKWSAIPYAFSRALGELASILNPRRIFGGKG